MTPNKHRGEVLIEFRDADGKVEKYIGRMTHSALEGIETSLGPIGEILERLVSGKVSYRDVHRILYFAIAAYAASKGLPAPTQERVGDLIAETGLSGVKDFVSQLVRVAFVGAAEGKAESTPSEQ